MNKELQRAKQEVLDRVNPAEWLDLADMYIELYEKAPKKFRLADDHLFLLPIIETYANNQGEFVQFVRTVRDEAGKTQYEPLHVLYRRILGRHVQKERRRRLTKGIELIEDHLHIRFTQGQVTRVATWLEQYWGMERTTRLEEARAATSGGRISTDVRTQICDDYWAEVDENLKNNLVPIPPEIVYVKLASVEPH
jgi:hypothetical protein